jgi:hypothetical protein
MDLALETKIIGIVVYLYWAKEFVKHSILIEQAARYFCNQKFP